MQLRFTKMHGLGNDFVVVDSLSQDINLSSELVSFLADRHHGVGCDQVLLIEPPTQPDIDFNYRIFNADGSEVEQCGNGARCLGKYVADKRLTGKRNIRVATMNSCMHVEILDGNLVRVDMGLPTFDPLKIPFKAERQSDRYTIEHALGTNEFGVVSMGNPHAVLVVDDIQSAAVAQLGPLSEQHAQFPARVNVGFMEVVSDAVIKLRVFERGVGETLACGTGACAAVVVGQLQGLLDKEVTVQLTGGELNIQCFDKDSPVLMSGEAIKVFDGKIRL